MKTPKKQSSKHNFPPIVVDVSETLLDKVLKCLRESLVLLKSNSIKKATAKIQWSIDKLSSKDPFSYDIVSDMPPINKEMTMVVNQFNDFTGANFQTDIRRASKFINSNTSFSRKQGKSKSPFLSGKNKTFFNKNSSEHKSSFNKANESFNSIPSMSPSIEQIADQGLIASIQPIDKKFSWYRNSDVKYEFVSEVSSPIRTERSYSSVSGTIIHGDVSLSEHDYSLEKPRSPRLFLIEEENNPLLEVDSVNFSIFEAKSKYGDQTLSRVFSSIILSCELEDKVDKAKLSNFIVEVAAGYNSEVHYHNEFHATDVCQTIFAWIENSNIESDLSLNKLDLFSVYIAAIVHDLGHPGYNNAFQVNTLSKIALTYNDVSVLEHFHLHSAWTILKDSRCNILANLDKTDFKYVRKRIIDCVLATDMVFHGRITSAVKNRIAKGTELVDGSADNFFEQSQEFLSFLIHSADISHNCKDFKISRKWSYLLFEEFFQQGDKEQSLGLSKSFNCDRETVKIPESQIGFIKGIIQPNFELLASCFSELQFTVDRCKENVEKWAKE